MAVQAHLKEGERLFAFLDFFYMSCVSPDRIGQIYLFVGRATESEDRHQHPPGKVKVVECSRMQAMADMLTVAARRRSPEAVVWRSDAGLPESDARNESPWCPSWPR